VLHFIHVALETRSHFVKNILAVNLSSEVDYICSNNNGYNLDYASIISDALPSVYSSL